MKIGIISGSVREGRNSAHVARWVKEHSAAFETEDLSFEIVALADFNLPLLDSALLPGMANRNYDNDAQQAWSAKIDELDGYIVITPEYNHGVPGALKNAFDSLAPEWNGKPVAFVSYGADGGIRATEQWRQIVANFDMYDLRATVALSLFEELMGGNGLEPLERRAAEIEGLLTSITTTTRILTAGKAAVLGVNA
ncbi:NADPH-dependent FMN reductase [Galactobacter valiniphilus]|uniref:NADPH-dependent FMN reductase n=1 Tax=Galactobacter valiniphilus TaxID=2676122 RepID=UPI0037366F8D